MDCSPPGSSVHRISQTRLLEWVAILQGIFLTQGSNLFLLHWQVDILPLSHHRGPDESIVSSISQSIQSLSCVQLFATPMEFCMPDFPVHHQLLESTQTHVHWVSDAIQPSHPLSSPSPPAPNPSQHQGLFQWVNSSYEVAKVLVFQLQLQSFQWTPRTDLL